MSMISLCLLLCLLFPNHPIDIFYINDSVTQPVGKCHIMCDHQTSVVISFFIKEPSYQAGTYFLSLILFSLKIVVHIVVVYLQMTIYFLAIFCGHSDIYIQFSHKVICIYTEQCKFRVCHPHRRTSFFR